LSFVANRKPSAGVTGDAIALANRTLARVSKSELASSADEFVVLDNEPRAFLFACWKNVTILAWAARADAGVVARLKRALARVVGSHPGGRSTVSVIAEGLPPPTDEARAGFVELMNEHAGDLACVAVVVQGDGFSSSVLRSVHTGMRFQAPRSYEMGLLGSIEELEQWLPSRHVKTGVTLEPRELGGVVKRALQAAKTGKV
jgi:hypothetical protein